jgi:beta-galactosidase
VISRKLNRRDFILAGSVAGALAAISPRQALGAAAFAPVPSSPSRTISLDRGWSFKGNSSTSGQQRQHNRADLSPVDLPHCVSSLSWQKWDPASWQDVWLYQRSFDVSKDLRGLRLFLHFDRIMVGAAPAVNGHSLVPHLGGFLPFEREITGLVNEGTNLLSISVDSRWSNIPPAGSPKGPASIDYMLPGGICGSAELRVVPHVFIRDVFAKPVNVLGSDRRLEITCGIDCGVDAPTPIRLLASLQKDRQVIAQTSRSVDITQDRQDISLALGDLKEAILWDVESPHLYDLVVTLFLHGQAIHATTTRVGFREARFELDGFFLNGKRLQLFGLNRHELYPYVGFAAPPRTLRRDAEYLRHHLNCNIVRCSHYPQSEAFLDACDEVGLLVWEEIPGWQYLGDASWRELAVQNVEEMVRRDRNHPSIVIWGVRINESANDPDLYRRTSEIAKSLDGSRPTSGSMTPSSTKGWREQWREDVFAFDDYHAEADGSVGIQDPLPGVPYLVAEAVGQFAYGTANNFSRKYRRAGDPVEQADQAILHAQAHSKGAANPRCSGVIAWCAFDYASLINAYAGVKCPGVCDIFRFPKLGASFYLAQVDPSVRLVLEPNFYWDFGPRTPSGPGNHAAIFSNCARIEVFIDGKLHARVEPDRKAYPNLKHAPFFVDLTIDGAGKPELRPALHPELRIDGYIADTLSLSRSFSSDKSGDRLRLRTEDTEIEADGSDAARVEFGVVDKFGAARPFAEGEIKFELTGPGVIVGDNPFLLDDSGGVGAIWIKSQPGRGGKITLSAVHKILGPESLTIDSKTMRG